MPLSKGGEHSYRNTACSCRECNLKKGDKAFGQLHLGV
jgi:5-methylcytosine-specific restriction endonuclease McrA